MVCSPGMIQGFFTGFQNAWINDWIVNDVNSSGGPSQLLFQVSSCSFGNGDDGFEVINFTGGTLSDNMASENVRDGFELGTFTDGTISGNTASGNGAVGFLVRNFPFVNSAVFSNNSSTNNMDLGYSITGTPFDGVMTNTGSGNSGGENSF